MPRFGSLICHACGRSEACTLDHMQARLRAVGRLKRDAKPDPGIVEEVFSQCLSTLTCHHCGDMALVRSEVVEDEANWGVPKKCEGCGTPISKLRLDVFPSTKHCAECQQKIDVAGDDFFGTAEYCDFCGAVMQMSKSASGGITRYSMKCPECSRR